MRGCGIAKCFYLVSLLFLSVVLVGGPAYADTGFSDISDSHWAANHISVMSSEGIVVGFEDGTFRPNDPVTQVQAVLMTLRCMGDRDVDFDVDDVPFTVPDWAKEDVARAMELKLLKSDEAFYADSAANRAWVTRLLVRLVGKESEALSEDVLPNFIDSYKIPDWATGYVSVAQDNNLVGGYDDNSFRPDQAVTRAEMAALLGRAMDFTGDFPSGGDGGAVSAVVAGVVQSVYVEMGALVVEIPGGEYRTLYLPDGADVSVPGSSGQGLDVIQTGDEVEVSLDQEGYICGITVKSRSQINGNEGIVYDLNTNTYLLTLQGEDGKLYPYRLGNYVSVVKDGYRFPVLDDVQVGDRVRLEVEAGAVQEIEVLEVSSRLKLSGTVIMISPDARSVTLEVDGQLKALRVSSGADIIISGLGYASLDDVIIGDEISVRVDNGQIVELEVEGRDVDNRIIGTVVGVDSKNRMVTLENSKGKLLAYEVKNNARILVDGDESSLSSIKKDMNVEARVVDDEIVYLEVDNSVAGTVHSLDEKGLLLVIKDAGGNNKTYIVDDKVDVDSEDGRNDWDEVRRGDYVKITLDDDVVTEIKLRTQKVLRVDRVREQWDRIEAEDEDGDSVRLYIRDGVDLVVPGIKYPDIEDVQEDDTVRATYIGNDLELVEVLEPRRGKVTAINTYGKTVTINYYDGKAGTLNFSSNCEIIIDDDDYTSLSMLSRGDRVEVLENVDGGYDFYVMEEISGKLAFDLDDNDKVYLEDGSRGWERYDLHKNVYAHDAAGSISLRSLDKSDSVKLYLLNDLVYEIEVW